MNTNTEQYQQKLYDLAGRFRDIRFTGHSAGLGSMSSAGPSKPAQQAYNSPPPPPPPVIPTSWLEPHEQRWFFVSLFGLLEVSDPLILTLAVDSHTNRRQ